MKNSSFILVFLVPFFVACTSTKPEMTFEKPPVQVVKPPAPIVQNNKGSLYSRRGASLFADKKDLQIGDIIQVVIDESLTSDTSNKRELTNTSSDSLGGGLVTPTTGGTGLNSTVQSVANTINSIGGVDFNSNSSSSFKGNVKAAVDESFSTTLSVIIEETYQNGNYYIKGSKEMLIDEQKQEIIISGVIRPYDITPDNSINSSQIANLKILYMKDGEEQDVMHVPWGTKLLKMLWPF